MQIEPTSEPMWHDLASVSKDAYEWLYFDVMDEATQTHVSIDFLAPNPFDTRAIDPRDRVGVITCISRVGQPGIEIDSIADRTQLRFSDNMRLAIGASSVTRYASGTALPVFEIELSAPGIDGRKVSGQFRFESMAEEWSVPGQRFYEAKDDPSRYHGWVVHAPRALTKGHLTVEGGPEGRLDLDVCGHGYHDHNLGTVPLAATVQRWFWARGSDAEHTVIAAHVVPKPTTAGDRWVNSVVYARSNTRQLVGSAGDRNVFDLTDSTKGANGVDYPALVEVQTGDDRRQPVVVDFKQRAMAIDTHKGYLRRYVDLSLSVGREQSAPLLAIAEDIVFP